jgi:glutathione synthase
MRIAFAITRAASVESTWTTVGLASAALNCGWAVRFIEPWDFEVDPSGGLIARAHAFNKPTDHQALAEALSTRQAPRRFVDLSRLDLLLLRAAPLSTSVLTFASLVQERGVRVVNDPTGLMRVTHKSWLAAQPGVPTPATVVTRSRAAIALFYDQQPTGIVIKPARGSGGRGVSNIQPEDPAALDEAFDAAKKVGDGYVVAQEYLSAAKHGEKRLLWLDGEVLGGYLRRRAPGEFRHNLKQGGLPEATEISSSNRELVAKLSPSLLAAGIRFAGLDVIGDHLIEVNVLNPGGAFHTDRLNGTHLAETIMGQLAMARPQLRNKWAHPAP